jgi:excinuclease ABC subunit C
MNTQNLTLLPSLPGVYLFKDAANTIIYVGKAKSIKKRVSSYFKNQDKDWKIKSLVEEHASIDHIVTKTETEALLLEAQLIQQHKPKFNVLLKSGQPFVYFLFTHDEIPRLELVRNKKKKGTYFGPFLQKMPARSALHYLQKTFRLDLCKQKISTGCLRYHIGMCAGVCMKTFDKEGYLFRIMLAQQALDGRYKQSLKSIAQRIDDYNQRFEFEKARQLVYYAQNLETIFATLKTKFNSRKYENDIFVATTPIAHQKEYNLEFSDALQRLLHLPERPITIDCFDISHFQSRSIVGSCIRFVHGVPDKNNFRRFRIKTLSEQNDYAALQEIVARRYKDAENMPDIVLIDGGKGQLNAVQQIIPQAYVISLAKREERLFTPAHPDGTTLDIKTEVGKVLIALRDYAHHFAISYHRLKRAHAVKDLS